MASKQSTSTVFTFIRTWGYDNGHEAGMLVQWPRTVSKKQGVKAGIIKCSTHDEK